jgi:DNA-binding CsgD family transcriptional regulator
VKIFTEKEFNNQGQHFAYKLRDLYLNDPNLFYQLQDYYPFPVYINERKTSEYKFFNENFLNQGREIEALLTNGRKSLDKIANPVLLEEACIKAVQLHEDNDYDAMCHYLQAIELNQKMTPFLTNKILINEELTLNVPFFPTESMIFNKVFKELIPEGEKNYNNWLRFQSLTKREKEVVKLIAQGESNIAISQQLFISNFTVKTHRKNIYKKLEINKTSQLVKMAILLELIDET